MWVGRKDEVLLYRGATVNIESPQLEAWVRWAGTRGRVAMVEVRGMSAPLKEAACELASIRRLELARFRGQINALSGSGVAAKLFLGEAACVMSLDLVSAL